MAFVRIHLDRLGGPLVSSSGDPPETGTVVDWKELGSLRKCKEKGSIGKV